MTDTSVNMVMISPVISAIYACQPSPYVNFDITHSQARHMISSNMVDGNSYFPMFGVVYLVMLLELVFVVPEVRFKGGLWGHLWIWCIGFTVVLSMRVRLLLPFLPIIVEFMT